MLEISGLMGLAYAAGTLLNGWMSFRSQRDNRNAQAELAQKQQEFQKELTNKNFEHSAKLQREITVLRGVIDHELQEARFKKAEEDWEKNQFVNNVWPLINTPKGYVDYLKQLGCPMSVIVTGKLDAKYPYLLSSASDFVNAYYANQQHIYYYNQGWKPNMQNVQGNAQRDALHQGLNGLPTLVVMPDIVNEKFTLDVSFWGFGDSKPKTISFFKRDWHQMEMEILRDHARKWIGRPLPSIDTPMIRSIRANIETLEKEEKDRRAWRECGMSDEEIEIFGAAYATAYQKAGLESEIRNGISQIAGAPIAVASGLYADAFLLGTGNAPKLPALLKQFPQSIQNEMEKQVGGFYGQLIQKIDELNRPKACALIAQAYAESGDISVAQFFQRTALQELQGCYGSRSRQIAQPHWEAIEIIRKNPLFGTNEFPYLLRDAKAPQITQAPRGSQNGTNLPARNTSTGTTNSSRKAGERMVKTVNGIEYAFRWCPPGTFVMGSPNSESGRSDNEVQHKVTLTKGFWMLETPVTQAMWEDIVETYPSYFSGKDLPVEQVSWNDCQDFCRKLSSKLSGKVSLPTEAQWEYACRAGTTGAYAGDLDAMAWYDSNSGSKTHPVRQKKPNAWGLYDMHGNVWEWCQDWYDSYSTSPTSDPTGPNSGSARVCRGGSWGINAGRCRSANRCGSTPDDRDGDLGFRLVLADPAPGK